MKAILDNYADWIKPDSYGITTYIENLRRGQYQIPTFQYPIQSVTVYSITVMIN